MRERLAEISAILDDYTNQDRRLPIFTFLMGKKKEEFYKIDVSNNQTETRKNLMQIFSGFHSKINYDYNHKDVARWGEVGFKGSLFFKELTSDEIRFFFTNDYFKEGRKDDFIKKRYKPRLFSLELRLTNDGNSRLMFIQNVIKGYNADFTWHLNIFDDRLPIQILDNSKGFTLQNDYSMVLYVDDLRNGSGFIIIKDKKPFENLFKYYGLYESCYVQVCQLECVDFSRIEPSVDLKRRSFQLVNNRRFDRLYSRFVEELNSPHANEIKHALDSKGIDFQPTASGYKVIPNDITQAKTCLRMLNDGVVRTILSQEVGLADHVDYTRP